MRLLDTLFCALMKQLHIQRMEKNRKTIAYISISLVWLKLPPYCVRMCIPGVLGPL